jgi:hypothetical protein
LRSISRNNAPQQRHNTHVLMGQNRVEHDTELGYWKQNDASRSNYEVKQVDLAATSGAIAMGNARYNTKAVRYIEWFVHLQRIMRMLMRNHLMTMDDPILHKSDALIDDVTEYENNNQFNLRDFE